MAQTVVCIACGHVGQPKTKGSFAITIILLFIGLLPGIIYEIWRRSGGKVCSACGSHGVRLYVPAQRVVQQTERIQQDEPTEIHDKTKLVAEDAFSYRSNILSDDEIRKQELRRKNQAFINRSKKSRFNFAKLLFITLALALGLVFGLAMSNRDTNYSNTTTQAAVADKKVQNNVNVEPKKIEASNSNLPSSTSVNSSFQECKNKAKASQLSVAGTQYKSTVIVDSDSTYMARICTNDGSVLITCSGYDGKMILTKSTFCT